MRQQKRPRVRGLFMILEMQTFVRLLPKSPVKEGPRGALGVEGPFLCGLSILASVRCKFSGSVA